MGIFKNLVQSPTSPKSEETVAPLPRIVVDAPIIHSGQVSTAASEILVKALPSRDQSECRLMVNQPLLAGQAWYFSSRGATRGSALAETVFAADEEIETLLVHDTTLTITRRDKGAVDWQPLARKTGAALRAHLESGAPSISQEVLSLMPEDSVLHEKVQAVIEEEINPGVASHGGVIHIVKVSGNAVTINMGGGCQGCSSAALTLKGGIERTFRDRVPELGALLDATDHSAGTNPYFS